MKSLKFILLFGLSCLLTGCGFHLYGKGGLPPQLQTVYVQSKTPYGTLESSLKQSLHALGANVVNAPEPGAITVNIANSSFTHDDSNNVSSSSASVYNFDYDVTFNMLDNHGTAITTPDTVTATRTLTLNPNEVLDANPEVDTTQQEMERDLVFQIVNVLNSQKSRAALTKYAQTPKGKKTNATTPRTTKPTSNK